eukprot:PhF_6_TR23788/c0_g1_i1/m.33284/K16914/RIOX1, NO66; bifunctional lysine-specific demethylase and histidyl-hydroxylase NO66
MLKRERCDSVVSWLLGGMTVEEFWATGRHKPFVVRDLEVGDVWSSEDMLRAVTEKTLLFNVDLNIVKYTKGKRISYELGSGERVTREILAEAMKTGWSVRFLRPHEHVKKCSHIIHCLEDVFGCHCGANTYYTPQGTQGFAPHFDDVDVFIVQTEGEKEWFVYPCDVCPRYSSEDFAQKDLPPPILHVMLKQGEMMFLPRGAIHQARSSGEKHSLHITFSANQCHTYADFFHSLCRNVIEGLANEDIEMRRTLPLRIEQRIGAGPSSCGQNDVEFRSTVSKFAHTIATMCSNSEWQDKGMDSFVKTVMTKQQPPIALGPEEVPAKVKLTTRFRMVSRNAARMVLEGGECRVYCLCPEVLSIGSGVTDGTVQLRFDSAFASAVTTVLAAYPKSVCVKDLPMDESDFTEEDKKHNRLALATALLGTRVFIICDK